MRQIIIPILLAGFFCTTLFAQNQSIDLSKLNWNIWLDEAALWENDSLFLPPVDITKLPVNPPTVGWDGLQRVVAQSTQLPATVEEYFWGKNGNTFGVAGNYVGVSWFYATFDAPENFEGKRVVLHFESVRLRAEVYVNQKLVAYDLINGTPFTADISNAIKQGANSIAVRITDPNGNFAWRDWETYSWGKYDIVPSHGFGGITGKVSLELSDNVYINDVYIKNKPEINKIDVEVELKNDTDSPVDGDLFFTLSNGLQQSIPVSIKGKSITVKKSFSIKDAKLWNLDNPYLYTLKTEWKGKDASQYTMQKAFGLRWFEIRDVDGDRQFYLNNKRIVLRTAISWGHWPVNGIYPTDELAKKQILVAKQYGLNMLNFHRGIGQTKVLNYADTLGLLYYQEPGGYRPGQSEFTQAFKREKLLRMVKRDRSHPSLIIYSMINEAGRDPFENEIADIEAAHRLDETRCITFSSQLYSKKYCDGAAPRTPSGGKMFMEPYDSTVYYQGWWDEHHAGGPGVYRDDFYNGETDFLRYINHKSEIIMWGEEGAIGTPPRLELLNSAYQKSGKMGWDGDAYTKTYKAYDEFLTSKNFRSAFPTVESLTTQIGEISHYYQGRIIENIRVGNITDAYAINGWEDTKIENHSGIVDVYRNPKANPEIIAKYNQAQYVAVKLRNKVLEVGNSVIADFYVINELGLKGSYTLRVTTKNSSGEQKIGDFKCTLKGGSTYGQLIAEGIEIKANQTGYTTVQASLIKGKTEITTGSEQLYAVELGLKSALKVAVLDSSGFVQRALSNDSNIQFKSIKNASEVDVFNILIVGAGMQEGMVPGNFRMTAPVMDWVSRGNTILFINNAPFWAEYLHEKEILDYRGFRTIDRNWFGGSYFVKEHRYFDGLPSNCVFNWEYQALAGYNMNRVGLRLMNDECIVGVNADHKQELFSALSIIPHGNGKVILMGLDITKALNSKTSASVVAKRIIENMLANP